MYQLIYHPNRLLRIACGTIDTFDSRLFQEANGLVTTLERYVCPVTGCKGLGLAANQVGLMRRIIVVAGTLTASGRTEIYCNPVVKDPSGEFVAQEGCLSHPSIYLNVTRAASFDFEYQGLDGEPHREHVVADKSFIRSVVLLHEIDHLNGTTLLDHMTPGQRMMAEKKLDRSRKLALKKAA